jgi:hypothetical protein
MIYCNNTECKKYHASKELIVFEYNKFITPFNGKVSGYCMCLQPMIRDCDFESSDTKVKQAVCSEKDGFCGQTECLHNNENVCKRGNTLIDISLISKQFICKCFSHRSISGHVDWFRNLNSDGTAKGGRVSDAEAMKMKKAKF